MKEIEKQAYQDLDEYLIDETRDKMNNFSRLLSAENQSRVENDKWIIRETAKQLDKINGDLNYLIDQNKIYKAEIKALIIAIVTCFILMLIISLAWFIVL